MNALKPTGRADQRKVAETPAEPPKADPKSYPSGAPLPPMRRAPPAVADGLVVQSSKPPPQRPELSEPEAPQPPAPPRPKLTVGQALAAPVVLFELWGLEPIQKLFKAIGRWKPIAAVEAQIAKLPPYGALAVVGVPMLLILPAKFAAVAAIGMGHFVLGTAALIAAKLVSTGLIARLFTITKPQLLKIGWFAKAYNKVVPWKDALLEYVHSSSVYKGVKAWAADVRQTMRETMAKLRRLWS